ncbi:hypothetical protein T07_6472 [Trichinella nelsoni]|uniref:Uncharacterized protein n=1 Tax=Trichinella nelsoni TaxID=6336 RepID=A0A0V0RBE1_9BILA|nr:hypothetical protein T07_6472 [Trichinella nelsoni]
MDAADIFSPQIIVVSRHWQLSSSKKKRHQMRTSSL